MSLGTILGIVAAIGLFVGSIVMSTNNFIIFIDIPSFVMVVGGTLTAAFIAYEARYVMLALKLVPRIFAAPPIGRNVLKAEVGRMVKWAAVLQKGGPAALEGEASKAIKGDKVLTFGVQIVVSNYTGQEVREIMENFVNSTYSRNTVLVDILKALAAGCPAFGMVGTLVGLVIMLDNMGGDPSALGKALAVALLTTLYGVLFAKVIFAPAASKILQREQIVRFRNYLVLEGLVLLADKKSPRFVQDKMNSFLDPAIHFDIEKAKG